MRPIDADALIAKWEEEAKHIEVFDHRGMVYGAINDIKRQPTIEVPRWIPVTERLPNDGDDVLITFCGEEETRIVPVNYYQKIWFDCIFDIELNPHMITAWMPLPKPWKGGAE